MPTYNASAGTGTDAYIVNGGTANVTTTGDGCGTLSLGSTAGSGTVQMTGGSLSAGYTYVGYSGTGTFTQSGGNNSITLANSFPANPSLYLGYDAGSSGSYGLSGTGQLIAYSEYVGYSGAGNFVQSGGVNTLVYGDGGLYLGYSAGSSGTYTLSGTAQLSLTNYSTEYIGYSGTGNFTQSGGVNDVGSSQLCLGYSPRSSGSYTLSGTGTLHSQAEYRWQSGERQLHTIGRNNYTDDGLNVGGNNSSGGSFNLSGGLLYSIYSAEIVGVGGSFTQSGGTNSAPSGLYVRGAGGAFYSLSGTGKLSANYEYVGNGSPGSFSQSGGTNTAFVLLDIGDYSGGNGTYSLSGTGQLSTTTEYEETPPRGPLISRAEPMRPVPCLSAQPPAETGHTTSTAEC